MVRSLYTRNFMTSQTETVNHKDLKIIFHVLFNLLKLVIHLNFLYLLSKKTLLIFEFQIHYSKTIYNIRSRTGRRSTREMTDLPLR